MFAIVSDASLGVFKGAFPHRHLVAWSWQEGPGEVVVGLASPSTGLLPCIHSQACLEKLLRTAFAVVMDKPVCKQPCRTDKESAQVNEETPY